MSGLASGSGTVCSKQSRSGLNFHETPYVGIRSLMLHEVLPNTIWEPMAGAGAIVRPLRRAGHTVIASDIVDRGCPDCESGVDFLQTAERAADCVVSNPPFNRAEEIIYHALYNLQVPVVYVLLRLAFLEGGNLKSNKGQCRRAVLDNGHLKKVLLFRRRLPMMHQENWTGKKNSNSGMPFGWFQYDLQNTAACIIQRIDWIKEIDPEPSVFKTAPLPPLPIEAYIAQATN